MALKIRCSQLGKITTGISLSPIGLTEKETLRLNELHEKGSKSQELQKLIAKRDNIPNPELSQGAKTYIEELWYENKFNFRKSFHNKYVEKGTLIEDKSIDVVGYYLGFLAVKNEETLENDYIIGTPDIRLNKPKCTIDTKNVYYPDGLKFFGDKDINMYTWQIHGYNFLDNKEVGFVCRILLNPTEEILEKEIWNLWKQSYNKEVPDDNFRASVIEMFNFESLPIEQRINLFKVETTQEHKEIIKIAVNLARDYYNSLDERFKELNKKEVEFFKQ